MARWGRSPFPRRFGGGRHPVELEHDAILDALAPYFDVTEDASVYPEALAQAQLVAAVWIAAGRARGALIPARMLETLTDWEDACRTRPSSNDTVQARRARVAAKLRGLIGNTIGDISSALRTLLGDAFVELAFVATANERTYWPGINPGPPGYEWTSNRAILAVVMTKAGLSDPEFFSLRDKASELVDSMLPAWMSYRVAVGTSGFVVNVGIVGQTYL